MFPQQLANYDVPGMQHVNDLIAARDLAVHAPSTSSLIIFFCFFYTAVTFQPVEVADNLKKQNAFIPGMRPGKQTADYIDRVVTRITVGGAVYVAAVCTVPDFLRQRLPRAVLLRRHLDHDRGRRRARHRAADRVAPDHASLRGPDRPAAVRAIRGRRT